MIFIDTHSHLFLNQFKNDRDEVIRKAIKQGIQKILLPNIDAKSITPMLDTCAAFPDHCFPMMGLHPNSVNENYTAELQSIENQLRQKKFYAIGEIGLDLYWDKTFKQQQEDALVYQIKLAQKHGLPIVVHTRNAVKDSIEIIKQYNNINGVFHSFTGTLEEAQQIVEMGYKIGVGGIITFKNSGLSEIISKLSLQDIVLETDAPYLSPVPKRGKRNESAYLLFIANKIAELFDVNVPMVAEVTTANAMDIFFNKRL